MKNKLLLLLLLLSACTAAKQQTLGQSSIQTDRKHKQRVAVLQKKLASAERALLEDQEEVEHLRFRICETELNAIESQLETLEQKWNSDPERLSNLLRREVSSLFLEERETLHRIIQTGSSALRAQTLLDRILQLITQVSDSENSPRSAEKILGTRSRNR